MSRSFDELSKALATGTNRRTALRGVLSGAFGAAVATLLPGRGTEAKTKEEKLASKLCIEYCRDNCESSHRQRCIEECREIFVDKDDDNEPRVRLLESKDDTCIGVCLNSTLINSTEFLCDIAC
jgi:hypothetical protein